MLRLTEQEFAQRGVKIARVSATGTVGQFKPIEGPKIRGKYGNKKTEVDGITFASKKEALTYSGLKLAEMMKEISNLELQPEYVLIPAQKRADGTTERGVVYRADFRYEQAGKVVVVDTKGFRTPDYIIKRKLLLWVHGITVKEV